MSERKRRSGWYGLLKLEGSSLRQNPGGLCSGVKHVPIGSPSNFRRSLAVLHSENSYILVFTCIQQYILSGIIQFLKGSFNIPFLANGHSIFVFYLNTFSAGNSCPYLSTVGLKSFIGLLRHSVRVFRSWMEYFVCLPLHYFCFFPPTLCQKPSLRQ